MTGATEHRHLALDRLSAQPHCHATGRGMARREFRENGDAEPGRDQRTDGFQFAALAGNTRLETGRTAGRESGIARAALVKDERILGEFLKAELALLRRRVPFGE